MDSNQIISDNLRKIEAVELTAEEEKEGLFERKKRKFFHERNKEHWENLQSKKGKTKVTEDKN